MKKIIFIIALISILITAGVFLLGCEGKCAACHAATDSNGNIISWSSCEKRSCVAHSPGTRPNLNLTCNCD